MKPSAAASYLILYRVRSGKQRMFSVAKVGTVTPDEARAKARRLLAEVDDGGDPKERRTEAREALTVVELCSQYLAAARAGLVMTRFRKPKRPSTIAIDEGRVARHIVPLIGSKAAATLSRPDVQRLTDAIAAGKTAGTFKTKARGKAVVEGGAGAAARGVGLLCGIWSWAAKRGLVSGPNPARGIETQRGEAKDRDLSKSELARLERTLQRHTEGWPMACAAVQLCALTGLRREEACSLRWLEIDQDCLRLSASKTGRST